jgi:MFS family permease
MRHAGAKNVGSPPRPAERIAAAGGATSCATELAAPTIAFPDVPPEPDDGDRSLLQLISHRPWRRWFRASLGARLPLSMVPLAFVLVGQARDGSTTLGATLMGVGSLCACVAAPLRGRLLDRQELRRALQIDCAIAAGVFVLLLAVLVFRLPTALLFVLSVGTGWASAGMMSGLRALLVVAVPGSQLRRSHFVESLLTELSYGLGPLLVGVLGMLGGVKLVLIAMFAIQTTAVISLSRIGRFHPRSITRTQLFRRRDIQGLTALACCVSLGYGILESNVPQRMAGFGLSPDAGGWFLGILAAGSCIGGVLASIRPTSRHRPRASAAALAFAFALLIIPQALARSAAVYAPTLVLTTLAFVPMVGLLAAEFESRLGYSQRGEGFAYFTTAITAGGACGYLANGLLIGPLAPSSLPWLSVILFVAVGTVLALSRPVGRRWARATSAPHREPVGRSAQPKESEAERGPRHR